MFEAVGFTVLASVLLPLSGLMVIGGLRIKNGSRSPEPAGANIAWPKVSIIVPVARSPVVPDDSIGSLLSQDYPDFEIVIVTENAGDPAAEAIRRSGGGRGGVPVRQVAAGPATGCSQKNANLLAGMAAAGSAAPILVFCDAGHRMPTQWLRRLVAPLVRGDAEVSSTYHHVVPGDRGLATLGLAHTVLFLYFLFMMPFLRQPWGGSMAIRRSLLERLGVGGVWERTVVDDVSLAWLMLRAGLKAYPVPSATIETPAAGQCLGSWSDWLTRQLMYLKFIFPLAWVVGGFVAFTVMGALVALPAGLAAAAAGLVSPATGGLCGLGMLWMFLLVLVTREFHPSPGGALRWVGAGYVAIAMTFWCHARTWFGSEIRWSGITYQVGRGGEVTGIRR